MCIAILEVRLLARYQSSNKLKMTSSPQLNRTPTPQSPLPESKEEAESARNMITKLTEQECNKKCADCGAENPDWASVNLGVFLCINCAGIHRRLSVNISRVRSIRLDSWTNEMVESMAEVGNDKAKEKFEATVPPCWVRPQPSSRHVLLEQWIRAKYERHEFSTNLDQPTGYKQGVLFKRKKQADVWQKRWFVLSHECISYFLAYKDREPRGCIPLTHLNATLAAPGLEDRPNSMLIAFNDTKLKKTRNIFVYAENSREIMDWFLSIRAAKIQQMQQMFPHRPIEMIQEKATRDFAYYGYLCKTPPDHSKWQRRFFVLDHNCLRYYAKPTDSHALGEIILGSTSDGFYVDEDVPTKLQDHMFIFMLHVPNRSGGGYPLYAESAQSKKEWMEALKDTIFKCFSISPDQSIVPISYEDDDIYATIGL